MFWNVFCTFVHILTPFTYRERLENVNMKDHDIIQKAVENIKINLDIPIHWKLGNILNGYLVFTINNKELQFIVKVKKEVRIHHLPQIILNQDEYKDVMLVAEKLYPKVKEELRKNNIPYLEANGNIFLKKENIWLWIDTSKNIATKKEMGNRAFTKTGLRVLFHLLIDKKLINQPQRVIAQKTGVGLGTIPQVIAGLKETGFLLTIKKNEYIWEDRKALLDRWITEYDTTLKPGLFIGRYQLRKNWQKLGLNTGETVWGGEPAGDLLTNYLRPEEFILYTRESNQNLIKNYNLMPDINGKVWLYDWFWVEEETRKTAPPILVYADLILLNNKRCRETAEKIFNEYIEPDL